MSRAWQAWVFDGQGNLTLRSADCGGPRLVPRFEDALGELGDRTSVEWSDAAHRHLVCRVGDDGLGGLVVVSARRVKAAWVNDGNLTRRQLEVCELAAAGATADEMARHLHISPHTVRQHLKMAYQELGVANRVELAHALAAI